MRSDLKPLAAEASRKPLVLGADPELDKESIQSPENAPLFIKRGVMLRQSRQLAESKSLLTSVVAAHPENLAAQHELAVTLRLLGDYVNSLELSEKILSDRPNHRPSLLACIDTNAHARNFDGALAAAERAVERLPDDAQLLTRRGVMLRHLNRLDESRAILSTVVDTFPEDVAARHELAITLRLLGEHDRSLEMTQSILTRHPDHRPSLLASVDANVQSGNVEAALVAVDKALESIPNDRQLLTKRGIVLRQLKRLSESKSVLSAVVDAYPDASGEAHELAVTLRQMGDYANSLKRSERILKNHPAHWPSLVACIDTNTLAQDFEAALAAADRALRRLPDNVMVLSRRSATLQQLGRTDESIADLRKALALNPRDSDLRHSLALSLRATGEKLESDAIFRSILAEAPGHQGALMGHIDALQQDLQLDTALTLIDQALAADPKNIALSVKRAEVLTHMGKDSARVEQLQRVHSITPGLPHVARALHAALIEDFRFDEADTVLRTYVEAPGDAREMRKQKIRFCLETGQIAKARDLVQAWLSELPDSPDALLCFYQVRIAALQLDDLGALEETLLKAIPASEELVASMTSLRTAVWDFEGALRVCENFLATYPKSKRVRERLLDLLWTMGDLERFKAALNDQPDDQHEAAFRLINLLIEIRSWNQARTHLVRLENAVQGLANPSVRSSFLMRIHRAYDRMGDDAALKIADRLGSVPYLRQNVRHYVTLADGHHAGNEQPRPTKGAPPLPEILFGETYAPLTLPSEQLAVVKRIAKPSIGNYETWLKQVMKAAFISKTLNHCFKEHPESFTGLDQSVEFPDAHILLNHAARGEAFLIASTHQGPHLAAWWLAKSIPNLRILSSQPAIRSDSPISGASLLIDGSPAGGRELLSLLKKGTAIAGSIDQPIIVDKIYENDRFTLELSLFDLPPIKVSNLIPRLAWKHRLPSYWMVTRLDAGKIRFDLERMPDATEETGWAEWARLWMSHYTGHLERYLQEGPENLNLPNALFEAIAKSIHRHGGSAAMADGKTL
ncbi:tetratricopeptide repeat protein [Pararhodobacter zhoushanensis]|uniref:tetratricopeptide repeat protein n=1 Tax=Pararhodobacter zhoushanensis TaxID=2479545 RepID=UPI000F8DD3D5|nr:tetratricopeptide repeat protein [Pararhodobacter zhoushanensis]